MEAGTSQTTDEPGPGCEAFHPDLVPAAAESLRRFLVGRDQEPQDIEEAERDEELNDPFAVELLRRGTFPVTAEDTMAKLDNAVGDDHPLAAATQRSFVVAEGSQIAKDPSRPFTRRFRFIVTRGQGSDGADLLLSAFDPKDTDVEVMAWDARKGGFNFYRTIRGAPGSWVWAGNSRHAWEQKTRGSGPFEAHPAGHFIFKEFKFPWVHWQGPPAIIDQLDFAENDNLSGHSWFTAGQGAYVLEPLAGLAIKRWNRRRIEQIREARQIGDPRQFMERFLGSPVPQRSTVNLVSSIKTNAELADIERVDLPDTFFVDADALSEVFDLPRPTDPPLSVAADLYRDVLARFKVLVRNHDDNHPLDGEPPFERPGDTNFVFLVPERAVEDSDFVRQVVKPKPEAGEAELGVVSTRLAACLLMVDFSNPVFSKRREQLLDHIPTEPLPAQEWPAFSETLGERIAAAGRTENATEAETEFAKLWDAGEDGWHDVAAGRLAAYYERLGEQLNSPDGIDGVFRLAEARRRRVRRMPIAESALLFAQSSISFDEGIEAFVMKPDGSVEQRSA
jgi:hypothetical protein